MISFEIFVSFFCGILFVILAVGSIKLKIPRKVSIKGIGDPRVVEEYDRISRLPQFKLIRQNIVKKLKKYNIKKVITDIGCGPGYLLQNIAKELPDIKLIGVDISKEMIQRAKNNLNTIGLSGRAEFKVGSVEHLPFEDLTQDFIISTGALHHFANPNLALDEIYRVLKPDGQMLIFDLRRDVRRIFFWLLWFAQNIAFRIMGLNALRRINEPTGSMLASYTIEEIQEIMSKTNFRDWTIEGKTGWIYIWARKKPLLTQ
ncbi:MAG: class I SAM-dependent methyltransferase [Candidatus Bathyarchaeota archaeon]|nr:class I SAM-dependent methyltransferase [Candidatus Bathyarchaeota archaeon]